jgi:hypothetical protein
MALTREEILNTKTTTGTRTVAIPEWGGTFYVRVMSARERDRFETEHLRLKEAGHETENFRARLCVTCLCDESGARVFQDADANAIGDQSADILQRVFDVASPLNGFSPKDVEELTKN